MENIPLWRAQIFHCEKNNAVIICGKHRLRAEQTSTNWKTCHYYPQNERMCIRLISRSPQQGLCVFSPNAARCYFLSVSTALKNAMCCKWIQSELLQQHLLTKYTRHSLMTDSDNAPLLHQYNSFFTSADTNCPGPEQILTCFIETKGSN